MIMTTSVALRGLGSLAYPTIKRTASIVHPFAILRCQALIAVIMIWSPTTGFNPKYLALAVVVVVVVVVVVAVAAAVVVVVVVVVVVELSRHPFILC